MNETAGPDYSFEAAADKIVAGTDAMSRAPC
jgi:hypothetical protein